MHFILAATGGLAALVSGVVAAGQQTTGFAKNCSVSPLGEGKEDVTQVSA